MQRKQKTGWKTRWKAGDWGRLELLTWVWLEKFVIPELRRTVKSSRPAWAKEGEGREKECELAVTCIVSTVSNFSDYKILWHKPIIPVRRQTQEHQEFKVILPHKVWRSVWATRKSQTHTHTESYFDETEHTAPTWYELSVNVPRILLPLCAHDPGWKSRVVELGYNIKEAECSGSHL